MPINYAVEYPKLQKRCWDAERERDALLKDAERYRWLRNQHWDGDEICVVVKPKKVVKLGAPCPSLNVLDNVIDSAMRGGEKQP